jgi:hypothetical protein
MFILGMLSVFQVTFLPGVLILKAFKVQKRVISSLVFSLGLSLMANYIGVFILTALGLYTPLVIYVIFFLEIVLALWLYRESLTMSFGSLAIDTIKRCTTYLSNFQIKAFKDDPKKAVADIFLVGMYAFFIVMAFSSLWWIIKFWWNSLGSVFTLWDSVTQWNGWAKTWFENTIPLNTHLYPQLMMINFSIPYVFMGSSQLQFFTTGYMPLFSFFILLMMFDLGVRYRRIGYFIGLVITRFLLKKFYFLHIAEGFVDLPLAFFSLVSIYCLFIAENEKSKSVMKHTLLLGAILSAGAAVTKTSGLYIFVLYPILAYFIVLKNKEDIETKEKLNLAVIPSLLLLLLVLPGYVFEQINIIIGVNTSNAPGVFVKLYGGLNYLERIPVAIASLEKYVYLYLILILVIPLLSRTYRWIALTIVFPYTLIWTVVFSYSQRNLSPAIPFLGLAVGMGLDEVLILSKKFISRIRLNRLKAWIIPFILVLGILGLSFHFTDSVLIEQQMEGQRDILYPSLNRKLFALFPDGEPDGKILTRYPVQYLPGFEDSQIRFNFETYSGYMTKKAQYPDVIKYLLIEKSANDEVLEELNQNIEKGNYELLFEDSGYLFIEILIEE